MRLTVERRSKTEKKKIKYKNTPNRETGGRSAMEAVDAEKTNAVARLLIEPADPGVVVVRRHTFLSRPCHPGTPA